MSDSTPQSCHPKDVTRGKSMQPYQSVWMAHWMHTSFKSADAAKNQLSIPCESGPENRVARHPASIGQPAAIETSSSKFVSGFRELDKGGRTNENQATSLQRLRNETFDGQSFPMFRSSTGGEATLVPKYGDSGYDASRRQTETSSLACPHSVAQTQTRGPSYQREDVTWTPEQHVMPATLREGNSLAFPKPYQVHHAGSTSEAVPYKFNNESAAMQTVYGRQDEINQSGANFLVRGKNPNYNAGLLNDPSTNSIQVNRFVGKPFQKMKNHSNAELFPSFISPYALPRLPFSPPNLETMRICTTIDSVEGPSKGPPKFSQTTHHFFFTKKTEGGQTFRETATCTELKGKPVNEVISLPSDVGFHVQQVVKLQPLERSADSGEKENIGKVRISVVDSGNGSSAETDTMDMDAFNANRLSGSASSPSNKDVSREEKSPASDAALPSAREESKEELMNTELPDINQAIPGLQSAEGSTHDKETSTSRTLSLGVDHFLSYDEQPADSRSSPRPTSPSGVDPYRRWVKRLKPNASSDSFVGTKSTKMEEAFPHEKISKPFGKILKHRRTSQEPNASKPWAKQQMMGDQSTELLRNAESTCTVSVTKSQDIALSHFWIQRWCRNLPAASKDKPEPKVVCAPQSLKQTLPTKQFPSIAAMALMGKAMNGFHPCQFRKTGSSVVWNTNGELA